MLLGFMPEVYFFLCGSGPMDLTTILQIHDPSDPSDRNKEETLEFARFKRSVYQKVLSIIFATCKDPSNLGEAMECSDIFIRAIHPIFHILSMDAEEAAHFTCCRAAQADHPCPLCLVYKNDLHRVDVKFQRRSTRLVREVLDRVHQAGSKTEAESILREYGLHDTEVSPLCRRLLCCMSRLILGLTSTSCGRGFIATHTWSTSMMFFIPTTLASGGNIYGHCFFLCWRKRS